MSDAAAIALGARGTLAGLFNRYDGTQPLSELVREAHVLGYTEPDPRDDLAGIDVAHEAGMDLELTDASLENLVPDALRGVCVDDFLRCLCELDAAIAARLATAQRGAGVLRDVAKLDRAGNARVELVEIPPDHAFAHPRRTDNIVRFTTQRYRDNPLVVQGPGAGPEVTAAGVFADLLRAVAALGAHL